MLLVLSLFYYYSFTGLYSFGSDLWIYRENFYSTHIDFAFISSPAYFIFSSGMSHLGFSFEFFRVTICFFFYIAVLRQFYSLSVNHLLVAVLFFLVLFFPAYQSLSTLVLRQGLGVAILMLLSFWGEGRSLRRQSFYVLIAASAHLSLLFYLVPLYLSNRIKRLRLILIIWMSIAFLYSMNVGLLIKDLLVQFLTLLGLPYVEYALFEVEYNLGFNANFLIPSFFIIFLVALCKFCYRALSERSLYLLKFFFITNGLAFLFSGFPYYDRLMLYSWVMIPLIILTLFSDFRIYRRRNFLRCQS